MVHLLFVYGSLKRGFHNARKLKRTKYLGPAVTIGEHYMMTTTSGAFPFVFDIALLSATAINGRLGKFAGRVAGELYEIDDDTLKSCDRLEGHPTFYERKRVHVMAAGASSDMIATEAFMYVLNEPAGHRLVRPDTKGVLNWRNPEEE